MQDYFLPEINKEKLERALASEDYNVLLELLTEPLHQELYRRQDFSFMNILSEEQQLLLSYDYLRNQVGQGGFIQFLVNGYVGLLPSMPQWLEMIGANEMAEVIDDALKVYVLNHKLFKTEMTSEEFAKLYNELKEFELLDERFNKLNEATIKKIVVFIKKNLNEFIIISKT